MGTPAVEKTGVASFAGTPYENSPKGWWTEYGGGVDVQSTAA